MIRPAAPKDIQALVELGVEALERDPVGAVDRKDIEDTVKSAISGAQHFYMVSEIDGKVEGAVGALTQFFPFHRGRICQIAQFYCRPPAKGDGIRMLRMLSKWADSRPGIRMLVASVELQEDERLVSMMRRLGYEAVQVEMIRKRPRDAEVSK